MTVLDTIKSWFESKAAKKEKQMDSVNSRILSGIEGLISQKGAELDVIDSEIEQRTDSLDSLYAERSRIQKLSAGKVAKEMQRNLDATYGGHRVFTVGAINQAEFEAYKADMVLPLEQEIALYEGEVATFRQRKAEVETGLNSLSKSYQARSNRGSVVQLLKQPSHQYNREGIGTSGNEIQDRVAWLNVSGVLSELENMTVGPFEGDGETTLSNYITLKTGTTFARYAANTLDGSYFTAMKTGKLSPEMREQMKGDIYMLAKQL
jgi:hypothetical protein